MPIQQCHIPPLQFDVDQNILSIVEDSISRESQPRTEYTTEHSAISCESKDSGYYVRVNLHVCLPTVLSVAITKNEGTLSTMYNNVY